MGWRDAVAAGILVIVLIASLVAELRCGNDSEHCYIDWSGWYPGETYTAGHCGRAAHDAGLGDPALSVSSLVFVAPLVYFDPKAPFATPLLGVFLGIASFLFHAANTETSHTLDYIGVTSLAPAIFSDIVAQQRPWAAKAIFAALVTSNVVVRTLNEPGTGVLGTYMYSFIPVVTALTLGYIWYYRLWGRFGGGAIFLVGGSATLIAANASSQYWGCVNTQAAEPHFWGHLIVAIGTVLFCRAIRENKKKAEYTALE